MGRSTESARPFHLLPFTVALLAALGWTGLRARRAADARGTPRPRVARPSPVSPLRFEPRILDLGRLDAESERSAEVAWCVEGTAPLRVLGVDATCGCVVAAGLPARLAPGDAGTLTLAVRSSRRPGPFRAALRVWLDPAPAGRPPTLQVRGYVGARVAVRPPQLDLGPRTAGVLVRRRVEVAWVDALADGSVEAAFEGLDGSVDVEASPFAGRLGASLRLGVQVPTTPGPFTGRVVVRVTGESECVVLPVRGVATVRR